MNSEENDFTTNNRNNNLQNNVGSFANHNNKESEDIKNRLDTSRQRNMPNNAKETSNRLEKDNSTGLPDKEENDIDNKSNKKSLKDKAKDIGKNTATNIGRNALNNIDGESEDSMRLGDKAFNTIEKSKQTIDFVKKVKDAGGIIKFFTSLGLGVKVLIFGLAGLFLMMLFVLMMSGVANASWSSKYGLTESDSYEIFDDSYEEGLSYNEVDKIYDNNDKTDTVDYLCKRNLLTKIKNLFGSYDMENICEFSTYVRNKIDNLNNDVENILSPGLVLSTLYYAYDTQLTDKNGKNTVDKYITSRTNEDEEEVINNDFDYITQLFAANIYNKSELDTLFDSNIMNMNHYKYYEDVIEYTYNDKGEVIGETHSCESRSISNYVSDNKLYLYLRFGLNVANEYEKEKNYEEASNRTDEYCIDEFNSQGAPSNYDLFKYDVEVTTEEISKDIQVISVNGKDYTYEDGFIYKTYPRYDSELTKVTEEFNYSIQYEIEKIIENLESRVDYINYFLGYPNELETSLAYSSGMVCTYSINGKDYSNIKVKLKHSNHASQIGVNLTGDIEGQELIDFETYIAGVVYSEVGNGSNTEYMKAQAVAARNYTLTHATKTTDSTGNTVLEIENSTFVQTYCDPYKGCTKFIASNANNIFVYTAGTEPLGISYSGKSVLPALSSDSKVFTAVSETSGITLNDSSGNVISSGYTSTEQNEWKSLTTGGYDYLEALMKTYKDKNPQVSSSTCTYGASGSWDSWKQYDSSWGSIMLYNKTVKEVGCFITAHTKAIAKSGASVKLSSYNPGTVTQALKEAGEFKSSNGTSSTAIFNVSLINGVKSSQNGWFTNMTKNQKINTISSLLSQGYEVVLRVKNNGRFGKEHWVLVTGTGPSEIYMSDPASDNTEVFKTYAPLDSDNYNICQYLAYKFN